MQEKMTFIICGRKLVLPATPDPIDFPWDQEVEEAIDVPHVDHFIRPQGVVNEATTPKSVSPKRKRFRKRKIAKS